MENRPRLVMNNNVLDIRRPDFAVDIIFTPQNYTPTAPIPEGARAWVVVNIQDPFLCRYLEGHPRYTATYRERGIHMWCGPHGRSMDVYIGLDLSLMAEVHRAVRAAIQLRDTLATIGQEARQQGYANLNQPQRMEAITAIMQERDLPEQERTLLQAYLATRPGMASLGINDPTLLGDLPLPPGMQGGPPGSNKENQDPNAGGGAQGGQRQ